MPHEHLRSIFATASVDCIVGDARATEPAAEGVECFVTCASTLAPGAPERRAGEHTEWILLTSGTTGVPKLVVHNLASLAGAMTGRVTLGQQSVWSTFYDIRRYGGLRIFPRAMLCGGSMLLTIVGDPVAGLLTRFVTPAVSHISSTPFYC